MATSLPDSVGNMLGGLVTSTTQTPDALWSATRSPQYGWVERLRSGVDFISPNMSLICVANAPFYEDVTSLRLLGMSQSFSWNEGVVGMLVPEIGSRRKRAVYGSSQGGTISIARMTAIGRSLLSSLTKQNPTLGIDSTFWSEKPDFAFAYSALNYDTVRTAPVGLILVETAGDGRNYRMQMFEQCVFQGQAGGYQAGQSLVMENINMLYEQIVPLKTIDTKNLPDNGEYLTTI